MVNFVLNSLNSGPELNVINPIIIAVIFTIVVAILDQFLSRLKVQINTNLNSLNNSVGGHECLSSYNMC